MKRVSQAAIPLLLLALQTYAVTRYVSPNGSHVPPYTTWATAATNIRSAVLACSNGDTVLVTNGVYRVASEVQILKAVTLRSVNGAAATTIDGAYASRCLGTYHPQCIVDGFTLYRGNNPSWAGGVFCFSGRVQNCVMDSCYSPGFGGGGCIIYGALSNSLVDHCNSDGNAGGLYVFRSPVSQCTIVDNQAGGSGGGVLLDGGGVLEHCLVTNNEAYLNGGGVICHYGGEVYATRMISNVAVRGGGIYIDEGTVRNCLLADNYASFAGGGAYLYYEGMLESSTLAGNEAGNRGGGLYLQTSNLKLRPRNLVVYHNTAGTGADVYTQDDGYEFSYCCTGESFPGPGNTTNDPQFAGLAGHDYRLTSGSPCVDTGMNLPWMDTGKDLDGDARIINGTVDMGCYELRTTALRCTFSTPWTDGGVPFACRLTPSVDGNNTNITFHGWDINNDGSYESSGAGLAVYTHVFTQTGMFDIRLVVSNSAGEGASMLKQNYIKTAPGTLYVAPGGAHQPPFGSWAAASTTIQAAVELGLSGSVVLLTNGTHTLAHEVAVSNGVIIRGNGGRDGTTVDGNDEVRCFVLAHPRARLTDLTVTRGQVTTFAPGGGGVLIYDGIVSNARVTANYADQGGGVYLEYDGAVIDSLILSNNPASPGDHGGGVYCYYGGYVDRCTIAGNTVLGDGGGGVLSRGGTIRNSLLYSNSADDNGGGVYTLDGGTVENCTVAANSALSGGGIWNNNAEVHNCVIWGNEADVDPEYTVGGTCTYSCSSVAIPGAGNIVADPSIRDVGAGDLTLRLGSPCVDAGMNQPWMAGALDRAGAPRISGTVDMGAYEQHNSSGPLRCDLAADKVAGRAPHTVHFTSYVAGSNRTIVYYWWDFDNNGSFDQQGPSLAAPQHTYATPGIYSVKLVVSNSAAEAAASVRTGYILVAANTVYVSLDGAEVFPYSSWATAAKSIAVGVGAAADGTTVIVSNGTYALDAQVDLMYGIHLRGYAGREQTIIDGQGATRCLRVAHPDALVDDLTVFDGRARYGAGVYLDGAGVVSNCILVGNRDDNNGYGAGAYFNGGGLLLDCIVASNNAHDGGGLYFSTGGTARRCLITRNHAYSGAGIYGYDGGLASECRIEHGYATQAGGAYFQYGGTLRNCRVYNNRGSSNPGGVRLNGDAMLDSCTVVSNSSASTPGGVDVEYGGIMRNSIMAHNTVPGETSNFASSDTNWAIRACCVTPLPQGNVKDSIAADPLLRDLVSGDLRLAAGSPCIDAGTNLPWMAGATDYAGNPRIVNGRVDIGSDELMELACNPIAGRETGFTPFQVVFTGHVAGANTTGLRYWWDFDGDGSYELSGPNLRVVSNTYQSGIYTVTLHVSNSVGETATLTKPDYITVGPEFTYVALDGAHIAPYDSWARAATSVPPAIAAGIAGTTVLLSNGTYRFGQTVTVSNPVIVRGAAGAEHTTIDGNAKYRCLEVDHPLAVVEELTLVNGKVSQFPIGGGVHIVNGVVRDCLIASNTAAGAQVEMGGTLRRCVVCDSTGGQCAGVYIDGGLVDACTIARNAASIRGGGVILHYGGTLRSSLVIGNSSGFEGGGIYADHGGYIDNCTVCGNSTKDDAGGAFLYFGGYLRNSIVYDNTATNYPNIRDRSGDYIGYLCTPDPVSGYGIISNRPMFANAGAGDYALLAGSPCINTGLYYAWMGTSQDRAGRARLMGEKVDLGAYEFPEPTLRATTALLDFGELEPGLCASGSFALANVGTGVVTAQLSTVNPPFACLSSLTHHLGAGISNSIHFTFCPTDEGWFRTNVYITGANGAKVELRGRGIPEPGGGLAALAFAIAAVIRARRALS